MNPACAHRLFHAALPHEWSAAKESGRYEVSTRGRTLAEEGFIHASYENQIEQVANLFYADVDQLVLLEIDRHQLDVDVIDESPTGDPAGEHFPHIYGPIPVATVAAVKPWHRGPGEPWRLGGAAAWKPLIPD